MRAAIALGSNIGDRLSNMRAARARVSALPEVMPSLLSSALYETKPVGCAAATQNFLNAVVEIGCDSEPLQLLKDLRLIEQSLGRPNERAVNAPRTIDLDLLYFGDFSIESPELTLPHPRLHTRRFVLQPLSDLRPDLKLPNQTETVAHLLARLPDSPAVVRIASQW